MKFIKKASPFLYLFLFICFFEACSKKHYICPAYNSYFIHDKETRESRFSPFIIDSLSGLGNTNQAVFFSDDTSSNTTEPKTEPTEINSNSKFQPKENLPKKSTHNGLLLASSKKIKSPRLSEDIEMKIIMVKPLSRYSNIDSSSITKSTEAEKDSL